MEKEISSGAMLGIVLIALAAIIGLGFGVFAIAKSTANEGVTSVQENLDAVGQSVYNDYDQKIVTGTQVMSCYQSFTGKNVAILIATQATKDRDTTAGVTGSKVLSGSGVQTAYNSGSTVGLDKMPLVAAYKDKAKSTVYPMKNSEGKNVLSGIYVNYNALVYGAMNKGVDGKTPETGKQYGTMYFDTNCFKTDDGFATDNGKVLFNPVTVNMTKSGMMEYVPSGARFESYLIKDISGTIMGIAFEQISNGR